VILGALGLAQYLAWRRSSVQLHSRLLWCLTAAGATAAVVAIAILQPAAMAGMIACVLVAGAGLALMIFMERQRRPDWVAGAAFATAWLAVATMSWLVLPAHDSYRPLETLSARINHMDQQSAPLYMVRLPDSVMTYYLDRPVLRFDDEALFAQSLLDQQAKEPYYVLAPQKSEEFLAAQGRVETVDQAGLVGKHASEANRVTLFRVTR
jgi:hypothetical protein